jgi:hypothetical protein
MAIFINLRFEVCVLCFELLVSPRLNPEQDTRNPKPEKRKGAPMTQSADEK